MDRIFLDANILFSSAYRTDSRLSILWRMKVQLLTSTYAVEEAYANLEGYEQRERLEQLLKDVEVASDYIEQDFPKGVELPEKDRPILSGAIAARATHLLTGDITHFGKYFGKTISGVLILPPADYLFSAGKSAENHTEHNQ